MHCICIYIFDNVYKYVLMRNYKAESRCRLLLANGPLDRHFCTKLRVYLAVQQEYYILSVAFWIYAEITVYIHHNINININKNRHIYTHIHLFIRQTPPH